MTSADPRPPDETRIFVGHDYKAPGRDTFAWETTVGAQKAANVHVGAGRGAADFIALREARDAGLPMPKLIVPSLQINMRGGKMPPPDESGTVMLKLPVNKLQIKHSGWVSYLVHSLSDRKLPLPGLDMRAALRVNPTRPHPLDRLTAAEYPEPWTSDSSPPAISSPRRFRLTRCQR